MLQNIEDSNDQLASSIANYLQSMVIRNFSSSTIRQRRQALSFFYRWCQQRQITTVLQVSRQTIFRYQQSIENKQTRHGKPLGASARLGYLSAVSLFFRWLWNNKQLLINPACDLKCRKPSSLPCQVLTPQQAEHILSLADVDNPLGLRDRAMLEILYSTGIRRQELRNLVVADINLQKGLLLVREGKGAKDRMVPVGERALAWVEKYLIQARPTIATNPKHQHFLFVTYSGKPFNTGDLSTHIGKYVKAAGHKGACHLFRHTMATAMLENGADIRYIKEILGHSKISSTDVYTRVSISKLKQVYNRTHPAALGQAEIPEQPLKEKSPRGGHPWSRQQKPASSPWRFPEQFDSQLDVALTDYLQSLATRGFSDQTTQTRAKALRRFVRWCKQRDIQTLTHITPLIIDSYQNHLVNHKTTSNRPLTAAYRSVLVTAVALFFKWLQQKQYLLENPAADIEPIRLPKRIPRYILSCEQIEQIMAQPDLTTVLGIRNRALLETLYATAIRCRELLKLRLDDVNFEKQTVFIQGKGNKPRTVPISLRAIDWLNKYLSDSRPQLSIFPNEPSLFLGKYGQALRSRGVNLIIKECMRAANIEVKGSCHLLRHAAATHMLENGADIRYIKELLGHVQLNTTQIYTQVSIGKLKQVHQQTHPAKLSPTKTQEIISEITESTET